MNQLMELDIPTQDKLYYTFVTGTKDPKKLYSTSIEFLVTSGVKGTS